MVSVLGLVSVYLLYLYVTIVRGTAERRRVSGPRQAPLRDIEVVLTVYNRASADRHRHTMARYFPPALFEGAFGCVDGGGAFADEERDGEDGAYDKGGSE